MESKVNYTAVGAFVLTLIATLIYFIIWLSGTQKHHQYKTYLVMMNESVTGLTDNSTVKYNGVNVGVVKNISLNANNPNEVRLLLDIEEYIPMKQDTRAMLMSQGLTGLSFVNLTGGSQNSPLLKNKKNELYPVIKTEPSLMVRLDTTVKQLSLTLMDLNKDVHDLLNKENRLAVKNTLQNLDQLTTTLAANTKQIDTSIKSTQLILNNVAKASMKLPTLTHELHQASTGIIQVSQKLSETSTATSTILQTITDEALPKAIETLSSLENSSDEIKNLAHDLYQNPSLFIRGRLPLKQGPGE